MIPNPGMIHPPLPWSFHQMISSNDDISSSSDKHIQLIAYQMHCLKKKMEILREKNVAILMKKRTKSSRKSQKTESIISQSEMKKSSKDTYSSIERNAISENSKTSNSTIVEQTNKVKNS